MKILYCNVIKQNTGWGAEYYFNRGLIKNGQHTINIDYRANRFKLTNRFLDVKEEIDVFFLQRGEGFPLELIRSVDRPRFYWASELVSRSRDQDVLLSSKLFNHIFVRTKECKQSIVNYRWQSKENVSILLSGFDETIHKKLNIKKDIDILWIGNVLSRRRLWLDYLEKYYHVVEIKAYGTEMVKYLNRAKIILNIHAENYLDTETRVFEVIGSGAFLLSEKLSPENPFIPGEHYIEVQNKEEMAKKISYYLKNKKERVAISTNGHEEALEKHTYTKRASDVTKLFAHYIRKEELPAINIYKVKRYHNKEIIQKNIDYFRRGYKKVRKIISRLNKI